MVIADTGSVLCRIVVEVIGVAADDLLVSCAIKSVVNLNVTLIAAVQEGEGGGKRVHVNSCALQSRSKSQ